MLHALVKHGQDAIGNLLLGDLVRDGFLNTPLPEPISAKAKGLAYARLSEESSNGDRPGSSAGGEQPKFAAYVETSEKQKKRIWNFLCNHPITRSPDQ